MDWLIFLVILGVGIGYLISRYNRSTKKSRDRTLDENLPSDQLIETEIKRRLDESLDKNLPWDQLTRTEKTIIAWHYYEEMTFSEIAARLHLPESKVSQMHASVVTRLKRELKERIKILKGKIIYIHADRSGREATAKEHLENLDRRTDKIVIEHPFFDDFAEAFQSIAVRKLSVQDSERLKKIYCSLFPSSYLKIRWQGWELGIPRPKESVPNEVFELRQRDIALFLSDFFKRVESGELYCDFSSVVDHFGGEKVEQRIRGKTGLHYNLERVYWTLNVKLNDWIDQNIEIYDCSLVCDLDEIVTKADSWLRVAFFPTPGPFDIGPRKRKKLQKQMLHEFAPNLEKPLIKQIWG